MNAVKGTDPYRKFLSMALYQGHYRVSPASHGPSNSGESDEVASGCVICLESLERSLAALPCGHVFHHSCAEKALAHRRACPVCRRKASPRNVVRLYLSIGVGVGGQDYSNCKAPCYTSRNEPPTPNASCLPERLREMKSELNRVHHIQRLTSRYSFRLENELVRRQQDIEQTTRRMQHIQRELDSAESQLKSWQRIATSSYAQSNQARQARIELDHKVRLSAGRMLDKIRERQRSRCTSCAKEWAELKHFAREFATIGSVSPPSCCQHHNRNTLLRTGRALPTSHSHAVRQPRAAASQHWRDCDF